MSTLPLGGAAPPRARVDGGARGPLFVAAAVLLFALGQTGLRDALAFDLPDNDDVMRLVQVRDWLAGQAWYDTAQHRFLPPAGASMHWSRWVDVPIGALMAGLRLLVARPLADGLTAVLWPPLAFGIFLFVTWRETRLLLGSRAAGLACLAATQLATISLWAIGRIDHHNVQATAIAAAVMLVANPRGSWRRPAAAGALCALSLGIGLETLPFVAIVAVAAALVWVTAGRPAAPAFAAFGAALALGSLAVFASQVPPARWFAAECDTLSAPWFVLTLGGGGGAVALALAGPLLPGLSARLAAASALGLVLAGSFVVLFPACLAGPYGSLPALARAEWLDGVVEAQPAWRLVRGHPAALIFCLVPLLAGVAVSLAAARRETGARRTTFAVVAFCLAAGIGIMQAQLRGVYIATALLPVASAYALERAFVGWGAAGLLGPRLRPLLIALATLSTVWNFGCSAVEAVFGVRLPVPEVVRETGSCARTRSVAALDAVPPGLILASTELGASLLVGTHHSIVAAPYHRNGDAIVAGIVVERGREEAVRAEIRRFRPDYILVCTDWAKPITDADVLAKRLVDGETVAWLDPVALPAAAGGLRLWRVRPDRP